MSDADNNERKNDDDLNMSSSIINSASNQDIRVSSQEKSKQSEVMQSTETKSDQIKADNSSLNNTDSSYDDGQDNKRRKRARTNYKDPENSAKLNAALSMLINQDGEGQIVKDIKSVAKIFGVPYNTLRDNFLRATTGNVNKLKKDANKRFQKPLMPQKTSEVMYVPIPLTQFPVTLHGHGHGHGQSQGAESGLGLGLGLDLKPLPMHFQPLSFGQVPPFQQGALGSGGQQMSMMPHQPSSGTTYFICAGKGSSSSNNNINSNGNGNVMDGSRMFFQMQPSAFKPALQNAGYSYPNLPQQMHPSFAADSSSSFPAASSVSVSAPPQQQQSSADQGPGSGSGSGSVAGAQSRIDRHPPPSSSSELGR